jgi:hypothetical protein
MAFSRSNAMMQRFLTGAATAALFSAALLAQGAQQPAGGAAQGARAGGQGQGRGAQGPPPPMTFFVTSVGGGNGANLGGLAGADAHCAALAQASGLPAAPGRTWKAYLSTTAANGQPAVNARDRIGAGPWHNSKGTIIANNVADLHGDVQRDRNQINKTTALTEKGTQVNGVGDMPNTHDMLTGSDSTGRAIAGTMDTTCGNWTSTAATGSAMLGHHDRTGGGNTSWNSAHASRGCSQENLVATGGAGLYYCFAAN